MSPIRYLLGFGACLAAASLSCGENKRARMESVSSANPTASRASAATNTERPTASNVDLDSQVLGAVLSDLLTYLGDDSPVATNGAPPERLFFAKEPAVYPQTVEDVLFRYREHLWEKLTRKEVENASQAAEHLVQRVKSRDLFEAFKPPDKRVQIKASAASTPESDALASMRERPISAWPPGYSSDRKFAAVRLVIPWSIHHAEATYLLSSQDDKWAVRLRQFVYYP